MYWIVSVSVKNVRQIQVSEKEEWKFFATSAIQSCQQIPVSCKNSIPFFWQLFLIRDLWSEGDGRFKQ